MKITGTKGKYKVGDLVVVEVKGKGVEISKIKKVEFTHGLLCQIIYWYFIDLPNLKMFNVRIENSNILGLAEITDNETKDNDGWIMVESEFPNKHKPIFFVTKDGKIIIGYYSYDLGECPTTQVFYDYNSTKKIKPKDVVKWQYVTYPKI